VKAGINVWTWGTQSREQFVQGVMEVSDIGYEAVENLGAAALLYEDRDDEFDALMASYGVTFACAYQHLSGDWNADYAITERVLRFLSRHGATRMNLQAAPRPEGGTTEKELDDTVVKATQIGELAQEHGVTVCLHPHYGTNVERADELAYVMDRVDPSLLSLTIDTAHAVLGGMDPVDTFARYGDRVRYVHVKDIVPVTDPGPDWWSSFRELGRGIINFPAIIAILDRAGFDGVLCVELDRPRICGYKSAAISRQYLHDELGI